MSRFHVRDKVESLTMERRFPYKIVLPRHPDQPMDKETGDPRKVWLYDGIASGSWSAESGSWLDSENFGKRIYRFEKEQDAMMFSLKWA